ncbi:polymorphic toxin-type HINT domain-containing protein, partial [Moraxella caprae]
TQEQKDTVTSVITLASTATTYGTTGDVSSAVNAGEVGKVGVEWNSLLGDDTRKLTKEFFENAANSAQEMYPESPALSGFFKGLSDAVDGGLSLTDASLETLATAIHCASGGDYCQDGFENNEERAQVLTEAIAYIGDGKASEQLADWAWRLTQGNIEEQHEATEQLARVSTSLGLGGIGAKSKGIENSKNILHGVEGEFHVKLPDEVINISRLPKTPNLWEKIKDWFKKSDKKDENSEGVYDGQGQQLDTEKSIFNQDPKKAEPKEDLQTNTCATPPYCFTAGTLIETKEGLKAIETFTGGELIWTRNDITLEYGYRPVIATKATPDQPIFQVTVKNHQGDIETLETTAEHPFWIKDTGWLKASLLEQGMILLDRNNQEVEV